MLWIDYMAICKAYVRKTKEDWIKFCYVAYYNTDGKTPFDKFIGWLDDDGGKTNIKDMLSDPAIREQIAQDIKDLNNGRSEITD